MAIDPDYLLAREWPEITHRYTEKDSMLYALGVGLGRDPLSQDELRFVYEDGLKVVPTQAVTLAHPGFWAAEKDINLDWVKLLHLGQEIIWHQPLPTAGEVAATTRFTDVGDKGARVGALIVTERVVRLVKTGEDIATVITTILARGDGGFSSERRSVTQEKDRVPDRQPDIVCDLPTFSQQALLYRLSGDLNPLHASPQVAGDAGYSQPILHGLCTMGVATHALMKVCCHYEPERLQRNSASLFCPCLPR